MNNTSTINLFNMEIENIILLLDKICSKSKQHQSSFNKTGLKDIEKILGILVLERLIGNLNSTKILLSFVLKSPNENSNVEPSIGLILRNNLNLCKIVFKHLELQENGNNLKEFYKSVFGENIKKTVKDLKCKGYTDEEIQPLLANIKNNYAFLLNETGISLDNIETENFNCNMHLSQSFKDIESIFDAYSKYEHFGLNTLILQANTNEDEQLSRIKLSIHYSLKGILKCLTMLQIVDEELNKVNNEMVKKKHYHSPPPR